MLRIFGSICKKKCYVKTEFEYIVHMFILQFTFFICLMNILPKGAKLPGTGIMDSYELSYGCWEIKP